MEKATVQDVYDALAYTNHQTVPEIIRVLENDGKRAGHLTSIIDICLQIWECSNLVQSKERAISDYLKELGFLPQREYIKVFDKSPALEIFNNPRLLECILRISLASDKPIQ